VSELGGKDAVSTQQSAVVELAVRTKLLLDSIDAWTPLRPGKPRLLATTRPGLGPI